MEPTGNLFYDNYKEIEKRYPDAALELRLPRYYVDCKAAGSLPEDFNYGQQYTGFLKLIDFYSPNRKVWDGEDWAAAKQQQNTEGGNGGNGIRQSGDLV